MKHLKTSICTALAVLLVGAAFAVAPSNTLTASAEGETYSVKTYVPDKYDVVDYYQAAGNISETERQGFTTFAHAGLLTPLQGANIQMDTQFMLLSKTAVDNGGDGIDGWVTYSFSATPAVVGDDKTYPYYGGNTDGYFLHITNYSSTAAPNCVEVQVVKNENAVQQGVTTFFLDNAQNVPLSLSLVKGDDGKYDLTFAKRADSTVLKTVADLALDESLFINSLGQTFFSTAIYEADGCDGNHHLHRGVSVASVKAYNQDITAANVALDSDSYTATGNAIQPATTVTLGNKTLENGLDYEVTYENNTAVGTGKAILTFYGEYGGNMVEKEFAIVEASMPEVPGDSSNTGSGDTSDEPTNPDNPGETPDEPTNPDEPAKEEKGCFGSISLGSGVLMAMAMGGVALARRKRK